MYTNTYHVPELAKTWVHSSEQNLGPSEGDALSDSLQRAGVQVEENVSTGGGQKELELQASTSLTYWSWAEPFGQGQPLHPPPFILASALKGKPDVTKECHTEESGT